MTDFLTLHLRPRPKKATTATDRFKKDSMQPTEFNWTNDNGNKIYAIEWPVTAARAVIGLIHGVGEHCRRYDHVSKFFAKNGIAVVAYDRQGYGRSEGRRGHAAKYSEYIDEVAHLLIECERRYPDLPAFLYGHSMGGIYYYATSPAATPT